MLRPDIMHLRNEPARLLALLLLLLGAGAAAGQQAQPSPRTSQSGQPANTQTQQPSTASRQQNATNGVHREGTDNVLVDGSGIPLEDQSGKTLPTVNNAEEAAPAPTSPPPNVEGPTASIPSKPQSTEPTKRGDQYTFKVQAEE